MPGRQGFRFIILLVFFCLCLSKSLLAQDIPLGHWRHHLPFNRIISLAETPDRIIGASPYGLIVFNRKDNSIKSINKVHGLSDFGITTLAYSEQHELVLVGYENGNLDVIVKNKTFVNIPDIRRANILGSKSINSILVQGNRAYLSCGFGIVELDLTSLLIRDTYFIGPLGSQVEVYDMASTSTHFFAATNAGLYRAPVQGDNLADYQNWQRQTITGLANETFTHLATFNDRVFANRDAGPTDIIYMFEEGSWQVFSPFQQAYSSKRFNLGSSGGFLLVSNAEYLDIFDQDLNLHHRLEFYLGGWVRAQDALYDSNGHLWVGDLYYGLVRQMPDNSSQPVGLPGPPTANVFGLASGGGRTWIAPGGISLGGHNAWNIDGVFMFEKGSWTGFNRFQFPQMEKMVDIIRVAVNPSNTAQVFAASWTEGLLQMSPQGAGLVYDDSNSPLKRRFGVGDQIRISGLGFDRQANLWMTNSQVEHPLVVKKTNGEWLSFGSDGILSPSQLLGDMVIDKHDQKWVILPPSNGLYLFRENSLNNANDFQARRLTTLSAQGGLPSNMVSSLAVDHDGYMWVGTDKGVAVFYTPQRAFSGEAFQAQQIIVEHEGFGAVLLGTETVTAIAIDGSNKKWFGTARSGAFLLSADARNTIYHFNTLNSPLPSNNILDISIEGQSGEVFFATDRGLVSFRAMATQASATHQEVYAFPNPVRPHYQGYIAIRGLVANAWVKITDINGNLVYQTMAEGGQAVWNGKDLRGNRPATGVYLVFSSNDDGSETMVTKILFIN